MRIPTWLIYLFAVELVWIVAAGSVHVVQLGWALLIGTITLPLVWRLLDLPRDVELRQLAGGGWGMLRSFVTVFVPDAVRSTLDMSRRILTPVIPMHPGIVAVPVEFESAVDALLLTNHISLTPGQLVVDIDEERHILYIHSIDARDPEKIRRSVQRLHRRTRRNA